MAIEVKQLVVKTNVIDDADSDSDSSSEAQLKLKRAVLEECRQMIETAIEELKER